MWALQHFTGLHGLRQQMPWRMLNMPSGKAKTGQYLRPTSNKEVPSCNENRWQ